MSMAISWKSSRHCMEMKSPARGDLTMPGKEGVTAWSLKVPPTPIRPHLAAGRSHHALEWPLWVAPLSAPDHGERPFAKAGMGGVGQRASSSEQGGWKLIWPTLHFPRSSPIPVCKSLRPGL